MSRPEESALYRNIGIIVGQPEVNMAMHLTICKRHKQETMKKMQNKHGLNNQRYKAM